MNERIKELALIARQFAMDQKNQYQRIHSTEMCMEDYREVYNLKFAELIVADCVGVAISGIWKASAEHDIAMRIKEHFGVE